MLQAGVDQRIWHQCTFPREKSKPNRCPGDRNVYSPSQDRVFRQLKFLGKKIDFLFVDHVKDLYLSEFEV